MEFDSALAVGNQPALVVCGQCRRTGVDGAHEGVLADDVGDVGDGRHVEQGGDARQQRLAEGGRAGDDVGETELFLCLDDERRQRFGQQALQRAVLGHQDLGDAGRFRQLLHHLDTIDESVSCLGATFFCCFVSLRPE